MSAQTREFCALPAPALSLGYLQYLPPAYHASEESFPLVIFLHGSGERGNNLDLVALHGWPRHVEEGQDYPFILVSPQLPENTHWCGHVDTLNGFLDYLLATLRVDPKRVYLTGLSDGGTGTWIWAMNNAARFAALIPVCGAGVLWGSFEMTRTPVWAFHGEEDAVIDCGESVRMVKQINEWGGDARRTLYPAVGHDSWVKAYADPALVEWMLNQRLSDR
jgi:predicted peptidase